MKIVVLDVLLTVPLVEIIKIPVKLVTLAIIWPNLPVSHVLIIVKFVIKPPMELHVLNVILKMLLLVQLVNHVLKTVQPVLPPLFVVLVMLVIT